MKIKLVLPWHYLILLALGLAVLWVLLAVYGRSTPLLIGWLVGWLVISRGVDFLIRMRRKPVRFDRADFDAEDAERQEPAGDA